MTKSDKLKVALLGNPNIGKTSLFNKLCGLNQKTGNYPGVTVDRNKGLIKVGGNDVDIIDLPGVHSLFPNTKDEQLVLNYLLDDKDPDYPDILVVAVSALNLKRNLYLVDQLRDLNIPMILAINMSDLAEKRGIRIDTNILVASFGIPVIQISAKTGQGIEELKSSITQMAELEDRIPHYIEDKNRDILHQFAKILNYRNEYKAYLMLTQEIASDEPGMLQKDKFIADNDIRVREWKTNESILRYKFIKSFYEDAVVVDKTEAVDLTTRLDRILMHKVWGYLIFILIMFGIFQSIFMIASYPMDWIDAGISSFSGWVSESMSPGYLTDLIADGIIPGIGGVIIFVPQIAILFLLFSVLEESGYMSRIVYLMDRIMQRYGMSGKSVVPMISGMACAVPAIMSARTIENTKERMITILVTPLLTCSARIPVYVIIISLIVPDKYLGPFNLQGLALMGMYLLGIVTAFVAAWILKKVMKSEFKSYLLLEMPEYLAPGIRNVLISMWNNVKAFIWNAGKIILATSIILFVLATNGGKDFASAEERVRTAYADLNEEEMELKISSAELESSYLGMLGKGIEPVIAPLGYDWKIGIAIISSLAAREVFVGTMSTIYSINSEEEMTIKNRLKNEKHPETGLPVFSMATSISLLLFYAFSLMCFSTVAVTYKETQSLKWTVIQFVYLLVLAYITAFIGFTIFS